MLKPNFDDFLRDHDNLVSRYISSIINYTESDPASICMQFLTIFGSLVGRNSYFVVGSTKHYTNIFTIVVGKTSRARKGTSWNDSLLIFKMLSDETWHKNSLVSGLSSGEGLISYFKDESTNGVVLVHESEFGSVLKNFSRQGNVLSHILRKAWEDSNLRTLTRINPLSADNVHLSLVGHITMGELNTDLKAVEKTNGLANRINWVFAERTKEIPVPESLNVESEHVISLKSAIKFARSTNEIKFDKEATELWSQNYKSLSRDREGIMDSLTSRAEGNVIRLSMLFALLEQSKFISTQNLRAALFVWNYCEWSTNHIFCSFKSSNSDKILSALKINPQGLSRTEVTKNIFGGNLDSQTINTELNQLLNNGTITKLELSQPGTPLKTIYKLRTK